MQIFQPTAMENPKIGLPITNGDIQAALESAKQKRKDDGRPFLRVEGKVVIGGAVTTQEIKLFEDTADVAFKIEDKPENVVARFHWTVLEKRASSVFNMAAAAAAAAASAAPENEEIRYVVTVPKKFHPATVSRLLQFVAHGSYANNPNTKIYTSSGELENPHNTPLEFAPSMKIHIGACVIADYYKLDGMKDFAIEKMHHVMETV